jgi:hypothetical protein
MYENSRNHRSSFETLEDRSLLSAYPAADARQLATMFSPVASSETELRTALTQVGYILNVEESLSDAQSFQKEHFGVKDDMLFVSVIGKRTTADLLPSIKGANVQVEFVSRDRSVVDGYIPLSQLHKLVGNPQIAAIIPLNPAELTDSVGTVSNAAESVLRGSTLNAFRGLTGAGVTIGVISDGVGGLANSQATGNLPPNFGTPGATVTINVLNAGSGSEGTAMLELIHDIAAGANLLFHSGVGSETAFATAVQNLVNAGAKIIVDDINGLATESYFADGPAVAAVNNAVAAGVTVFSSAGNRGDNGFESITRFVANQSVLGHLGTFHDFSGTGDFLQTVSITADAIPPSSPTDFRLQFDQLFAAVTSDVRLRVFTTSGVLLSSSSEVNNVVGNPNDTITNLIGSQTVQLAVELVSGPPPSRFKWIHHGDIGSIEYDGAASALRTARNPGHAAAISNISVGATDVANPLVRRTYSGIGHATRSLTSSGAPTALELRGGPTLMGVDGTQTSVPGFQPFNGTSAAAPNVAAIAALMLQADPSLTPQGVRLALTGATRDIDAVGVDLTSGAGLVDALGGLGLIDDVPRLVGLANNQFIVINDTRDLLDANPNDGVIDVDLGMSGLQVSLRAATIAANAGGSNATTLLMPKATYNLTLSGSSSTQGDLEISGSTTIVGTGAGETVIDASTLSTRDRVFQVEPIGAFLSLSRLTVTGGLIANTGGGILVQQGGSAELNQVAVVGNTANGFVGGGVRVAGASGLIVRNSVFTNNSGSWGGDIYLDNQSSFKVGSSVFARNTATSGNYKNVYKNGTPVNEGNNLADDNQGILFSTSLGDFIGTVHYVVTGLADTINTGNNATVLSLREAMITARDTSGAQTIWLPAWTHRLTISGNLGTEQGDLEVFDVVSVRGTGAGSTVIDASGLTTPDRVFQVEPVGASLSLSRLTVTGGRIANTGGGILVQNGGFAELNEVAVVGNTANGFVGGGVRVAGTSTLIVRNSVFTNNKATWGGAIYLDSQSSFTVGSSVFAKNTVTTNYPNIAWSSSSVNEGKNRADNNQGNIFNSLFGDYIGPVNYLVTGVADTCNHVNDGVVSS